jgi:phosphate transport system substrate-binding protein
MDPLVREFLRYVLSQEGQADIVRDGKYLPLTADVVREQLKKLDQ